MLRESGFQPDVSRLHTYVQDYERTQNCRLRHATTLGEESRRIFDSSACVVALRSVMRITYLAWRFSRATLYFEREFGGVWNEARDL